MSCQNLYPYLKKKKNIETKDLVVLRTDRTIKAILAQQDLVVMRIDRTIKAILAQQDLIKNFLFPVTSLMTSKMTPQMTLQMNVEKIKCKIFCFCIARIKMYYHCLLADISLYMIVECLSNNCQSDL